MGTKSRVGQYGTMPEDLYLRKYETTFMPEDVDQTESYQRQLLKNRKPDPYLFESDAPRVCSESKCIINQRYGGYRTNTEPYLPDGLFLQFDHFDKDPRSIMLDPDFTKMKEHSYARGKLTNYYPDEDNSVLEEGINPLQMRENIIQSIPLVKNYKKIFETSRDGRSNKVWMPHFEGHCKDLAYVDHQILDLNAATCANRNDFTTSFGNATPIGWLTDIDTRFKVAKYGQIRPEKAFSKDWHKTRREVKLDQMFGVSFEGINLTRDIALAMIDHIRNKKHQIETGRNTLFGEGTIATNQVRKDTADRIDKLIVSSTARAAHTVYSDEAAYAGSKALVPKLDLANVGSRNSANPHIIELMQYAAANRKEAVPISIAHDLQDLVFGTAPDAEIISNYQPQREASKQTFDSLQNRNIDSGHIVSDSTAIRDYRAAKPPSNDRNAINDEIDFEAYKSDSASNINLRSQETFSSRGVEDFVGDARQTSINGDATKNRFVRSMDKSNMRNYVQSTAKLPSISEITS